MTAASSPEASGPPRRRRVAAPPPAARTAVEPIPPAPEVGTTVVPTVVPTAAELEPIQTPPQTWFWCPTCLLVTEKNGTCAGCRQPYQPAPSWGIPYGPYRPPQRVVSRTGSIVGASILGVVLLATLGGAFFLFRSGSSLGSKGGARSGSTAFSVRSLGGTLALPGTWVTDQQVGENLKKAVTAGATGTVKAEVSARKGRALVAVVTIPTDDPASFVEQQREEQASEERDAEGNTNVRHPTQITQVAKYQALISETEVKSPQGELLQRARFYFVNAKDQVVLIQVAVAGAQIDRDFPGIEQAITAIG